MFSKNGYPSTVFNKTVDKFLSSRDRPQESSVETENDQKQFGNDFKIPTVTVTINYYGILHSAE